MYSIMLLLLGDEGVGNRGSMDHVHTVHGSVHGPGPKGGPGVLVSSSQ